MCNGLGPFENQHAGYGCFDVYGVYLGGEDDLEATISEDQCEDLGDWIAYTCEEAWYYQYQHTAGGSDMCDGATVWAEMIGCCNGQGTI